jgi:hypothetical protein
LEIDIASDELLTLLDEADELLGAHLRLWDMPPIIAEFIAEGAGDE